MKGPLEQALVDIVEDLDARDVSYALVGGLATSLRGKVRVTNNVDLIVHCDVEQALSLINDLDPNRFRPLVPDVESVARTAFLIPLVHQTTGVQLDLAVGASGFEQQIVDRATKLAVSGRELAVATAEDLLLMKALAGRPQDDQDIEGIISIQRDAIDWDYCIHIAEQLEQAVDIDLANRIRKLRQD